MKKTLLLSLILLLAGFLAKSQNVNLLMGEPATEAITYYDFAEWTLDDPTKVPAWYHDFGGGRFTVWANNPATDGINETHRSLLIETVTAPDWWGNFFNFRLETPVTITESNRYLHIMHYRENLTNGWSVSINANEPLGDDAQGNLRFDGDNTTAGVWEDIVIDLNHLITTGVDFEKFMLIVDKNWDGDNSNNPPTKYYFDEIVLSADPTPRTTADGGTLLLSGEIPPEPINYADFAEWTIDDVNMIPAWYYDFGDGNYATWAVNPDADGANTSMNSLLVKTVAAPNWWGNFFNFRLETPITITEENRYLHFYHYRENLTDGWSVSINANEPLADGDKGTLRFDGQNTTAGVWEDIVIDLNHLIGNSIAFEKFMIIVDINWDGDNSDNPPTEYYFDEIILSNDPNPRNVATFDLTINVIGNGSIEANGVTYTETIAYAEGATVNLEALADSGWLFDGWSGDLESTEETETITMDADKTITATFSEIPDNLFTLTLTTVGSGKVHVNDMLYDEPMLIEDGTIVDLMAIAGLGWEFTEWTGDITSADASTSFTMSQNIEITVTFSPVAGDLVLLTGDAPDEPIVYYDFVEWALDDPGKIPTWYHDFGDATYTILADNPDTETGNGSAKSVHVKTIAGPDWWGNFFNFRLGEPIHITEHTRYLHILHWRENLNDGWSFSINTNEPLGDADQGIMRFDGNNLVAGEWEDIVLDLQYLIDNSIPLNRFMVIVDKDWNGPRDNPPTEYFFDEIILSNDPTPRILPTIPTAKLNITIVGNGTVEVNGEVYSDALTVDLNSELTLVAVPDTDWLFDAWSGDITSVEATTTLTMDADKNVTVTFTSTVGIGENTLNASKLYPNPFSSELFISNTHDVKRISISNLIGQNVADVSLNNSESIRIATHHLDNGIYLVTIIRDDNSREIHKMVKN
jgi:uncharacterized repeat protein (TIGR02543 family)